MRIVVIGPTQLTKVCLQALISGKYDVAAVFALSDEKAISKARAVLFEDICNQHNIPLFKVEDINSGDSLAKIRSLKPGLILQLGWSQIFSAELLSIPLRGCIGVHASLLPQNRGGASLNWALILGAKEWGVSLFYMTPKVDRGDLIASRSFRIEERDDIRTLHDKSDFATASLLLENLPEILAGKAVRKTVDYSKSNYLKARRPEDGKIDWGKTSEELYNWVRGQAHPFPGAFTRLKGRKIFIWKAERHAGNAGGPDKQKTKPGEMLMILEGKGILVSTSDNSLLLTRIQQENEAEMWADDFARLHGLKEGDLFG